MPGPTVTLEFQGDVDNLRSAVGTVGLLTGGLAAGGIAAGAILGGLPLLIGGIGIAVAAQNQQVKDSFTGLKDHVSSQMQTMVAPLVPVLVSIADRTREAFDSSSTVIGQMFAGTAPLVSTFADGVLGLVTNLLPGLNTVIASSGPVVAALSTGLSDMGTAISGMLTTMSGQSGGAATAIAMVFDAVNFLLGVIGNVLAFTSEWSAVLMPLAGIMLGLYATVTLISAGLAIYNSVMAAVRIATLVWTGVQWALNAAFFANPIVWVVALIALLVGAIIYAWNNCEQFRAIVLGVWGAVQTGISTAVNVITGAIGWFGQLPGMVGGWFGEMRDRAIERVTGLIDFVRSLPGRIMGVLGNMGSLLVNAGRSLIDGFVNGIRSAIGGAINAVSGFMGSVRNLFPFSPAKEGPFSGTGYTSYSGLALATDFASGIQAGSGDIMAASQGAMAGAAAGFQGSGVPGGGSGGGGGRSVEFAGNTTDALATVIMMLIRTGKVVIR